MLLIINIVQIIAYEKTKIHDVIWKKNKEIWILASCDMRCIDGMINTNRKTF